MRGLNFITVLNTVLLLSACAPVEMTSELEAQRSLSSTEGKVAFAPKVCHSFDYKVIQNILKDVFQIPEGDVPMRDDNGEVITKTECGGACYYIKENAALLSDASDGKAISYSRTCSTSKFKLYTEIFTHACFESLKSKEMKEKLYPKGINNFDYLYGVFLSRKPNAKEKQILNDLIASVSEETAAVAVCSVIASSLEAVIQ